MLSLSKEQYQPENILSEKEIIDEVIKLKEKGKIIGLCDGSFDLVHPGHLTHLSSAKKYCDILIVAIASDNHSHQRKGIGRPIYPAAIRSFFLMQLETVDFVIFVDGLDQILHLLESVKINYYIRGPDYADEKNKDMLRIKEILNQWSGKIVYTNDEKLSTTQIIRYIQQEVKN